MAPRYRERTPLHKPPLLITESASEFDALREALELEIKPRGIIEQMYVADIASIVWEILRLRRCKDAIINTALRKALQDILQQLLWVPPPYSDYFADDEGDAEIDQEDQAENQPDEEDEVEPRNDAGLLALAWFSEPEAKKRVSELFSFFQLDESAIEAQAIRNLSEPLEWFDKMLVSLETRRNNALRCISEYRETLGQQLRESTDRLMKAKDALQLEHNSTKKSAA